jgi:hypothetical protein
MLKHSRIAKHHTLTLFTSICKMSTKTVALNRPQTTKDKLTDQETDSYTDHTVVTRYKLSISIHTDLQRFTRQSQSSPTLLKTRVMPQTPSETQTPRRSTEISGVLLLEGRDCYVGKRHSTGEFGEVQNNNEEEFANAIPLSERRVCAIDEHGSLYTCMHARQQASHYYHCRGARGRPH